jgi:hypothetical protein
MSGKEQRWKVAEDACEAATLQTWLTVSRFRKRRGECDTMTHQRPLIGVKT